MAYACTTITLDIVNAPEEGCSFSVYANLSDSRVI